MMKSIAAIATLASVSMAGRYSGLFVNHDFAGEDEKNRVDVLALMDGVTSEIKYPKDRRARDGSCEGWTLTTLNEDLDSFQFAIDDSTRCKKIQFSDLDAASQDIEELNFTNDCGDGDETWTIKVQVLESEAV